LLVERAFLQLRYISYWYLCRQRLYGVHLRDSISDLAGICRLARKLSEQANRHAHGDVAMETLSFEGSEGDSDASSNEELMFGKSESAPDFETLVWRGKCVARMVERLNS
jgi:hypothetical protein